MTGTLIILGMVGVPCFIALVWMFTPWGIKWRKENQLL